MSNATAAPGKQDQAAARQSRALIVAAIALALIVLWGGYIEHWPVYDELRRTWNRRHALIALCGLAAFGAVILGGYLEKWSWTGFHGNTVWDWLHLLLLPLLIPIVVVPALKPVAMSGVTVLGEDQAAAKRTAEDVEREAAHTPAPTGVGAES
jgi:hypothetical protein